MNRRRTLHWMIASMLLIFACAPVLSPSPVATLDPASLGTAIALTAGAAAVGTAGAQPVANTPGAGGPVLGPDSLNTAIAETAAAAGTQTAALIPVTFTPSFTPFPTWTASVVPTSTPTFIFTVATWTNTPKPRPTATTDSGGGGGGRGGYSCSVVSVSPSAGSAFSPNDRFTTVWRVRNTGNDWLKGSADLIYVNGSKFNAPTGFDFNSTVREGQTTDLQNIDMRAPGSPGTYSATWNIRVGGITFCNMQVSIVVQ